MIERLRKIASLEKACREAQVLLEDNEMAAYLASKIEDEEEELLLLLGEKRPYPPISY